MKVKMEIKNALLQYDPGTDKFRVRVRLSAALVSLGPMGKRAAQALEKSLNKKAEKKATATIEV